MRLARGHASAKDLERAVQPGALVTTIGEDRQADGTFRVLRVTVIGVDGRQRDFVLRGAQAKGRQLKKTIANVSAAGAVFSPAPSLDLQLMLPELPDVDTDDWMDLQDDLEGDEE